MSCVSIVRFEGRIVMPSFGQAGGTEGSAAASVIVPSLSGGARAGPSGSRAGQDERDIVDDAPRPVLARLHRSQDGVADLARVAAGVPVGRRVAAADLPAGLAHPKMQPPAPGLEALLAAGDRSGGPEQPDLVEMGA